MYSMSAMFEAYYTLAAFSEMFEFVDYFSGLFHRKTYTNHCLREESKNEKSTNEWTTEWLENRVPPVCNESPNHESSSITSSESIESTTFKNSAETESSNKKPELIFKNDEVSLLENTNEEGISISESFNKTHVSIPANNNEKYASVPDNCNKPAEIHVNTNEVYTLKIQNLKTDTTESENMIYKTFNDDKVLNTNLSDHSATEIIIKETTSELETVKSQDISKVKKFENRNENDSLNESTLDSKIFKTSKSERNNSKKLDSLKQRIDIISETVKLLNNNEISEPIEHLTSRNLQFNAQIKGISKSFEQNEHDEKLNNFEECTEKVQQILADKRFGDKINFKKSSIWLDSESGNLENQISLTKKENQFLNSHSTSNISKKNVDVNSEPKISENVNSFSNEVKLELNSNQSTKKVISEDLKLKKFITSSWDLVSIVKLLYYINEPEPPKVFDKEKTFQRTAYVFSKGAFTQHPEGFYNILIQNTTLHIQKEKEDLLKLTLDHAEIHLENDILVLDNKMGRSLYMKCDAHEEMISLKEELEQCCCRCWEAECINLVHYPLKCHQNIIIIDLGSCSSRAGILMDQPTLPTLFFPSICSTNKTTGKHLYGLEALKPDSRQNSTVSFPLRPSIKIVKHTVDIDQVTGIFKKIFADLKVNPINYKVLVCLPRSLSINDQNAMVEVLLDVFNVEAVSLAHQAILTMYAHNVSTGLVVDIGDRMDILPVIDGFIVENGVTRLPFGGQRLIHHMKHALAQKHISLSNDLDSFVVQYITENLAYVAEDYNRESQLATSHPQFIRKSVDLQKFALDVNCLQSAILDDARFKVPEGLFDPDLWGLDSPGVHKLVQKAILAVSVDARKKVAENIYLSGGVTMIPGFVERLRKEVTKMNEPRIIPKVYASHYRYHCTYIGACRFARMDVFSQVCVTKEEYNKDKATCLKKFMLCV